MQVMQATVAMVNMDYRAAALVIDSNLLPYKMKINIGEE